MSFSVPNQHSRKVYRLFKNPPFVISIAVYLHEDFNSAKPASGWCQTRFQQGAMTSFESVTSPFECNSLFACHFLFMDSWKS